tara:strand:- start:65 stop:346 length:282 start_codon:yes stop_codon:yes gene_type:complete
MTASQSKSHKDRSIGEWSEADRAIEQEFAEVISFVQEQYIPESVPPRLDKQIKRLANGSALEEIEKSWLLSSGARLTLVILLFFSIAMLWLIL